MTEDRLAEIAKAKTLARIEKKFQHLIDIYGFGEDEPILMDGSKLMDAMKFDWLLSLAKDSRARVAELEGEQANGCDHYCMECEDEHL